MKSSLSCLKNKMRRPNSTKVETTEKVSSDEIPGMVYKNRDYESNPDQSKEEVKKDISIRESMEKIDSPQVSQKIPAKPLTTTAVIKWCCGECKNECIPVMRESRCLCGHRMKDHKQQEKEGKPTTFPCSSSKCKCKHFFYLVAEGAWILRCRCKHKHTDHNCENLTHNCLKCEACTRFDSPWVCNCGHNWSSHKQTTVFLDNRSGVDDEFVKIADSLTKKQFYLRQDGMP